VAVSLLDDTSINQLSLLHIFESKSNSILEHANPNQKQAMKWIVSDPKIANLMVLYNNGLDPGSFCFNPVSKKYVLFPTCFNLEPL